MISSFIITGFLGVGKTTMLTNSVKKYFTDKKIAIVVNEFGDVGVDSKILKNVYSEVLEISEGCICCQLAEEFEKGVSEIIAKYEPEIIFVETSGASEPFPIFLSMQNLGVSIDGVVCVIDSKNLDSYKENSTAKYQIGGSNILILNKTDLVNDEELALVEKEVRDIKEEYNIKNTFTKEPIFKNYAVLNSQQGLVNKEAFEGLYQIEEVVAFAKEHKHHDHTKKDAITQKVVYLDDNIVFNDLDNILKTLPDNEEKQENWMGCRPSLPDSLPVICQAPNHDKIFFALGHQHLGLTQGAITGKLIGQLVTGKSPEINLDPFCISRFN